jgi:hypothetical protein
MFQIWSNLVAMLVCAVVAHLYPAATLIVAYAFLGPAHYLTEMSWLHDRRYFVSRPGLLLAAVGIVVLVTMLRHGSPEADSCLAAIAAGLLVAGLGGEALSIVIWGAAALSLGLLSGFYGWRPVLAFLILLPTLIHVGAFTAMFVVSGALRKNRRNEWFLIAGLFCAATSFFVVPTASLGDAALVRAVKDGFLGMFGAMGAGGPTLAPNAVGFAAFAYSYHYLNWFLKTGFIGWHKAPVDRLVVLFLVWLGVTCSYLYNVALGLVVSLPLSFGHVLLEFPLNVSTGRKLWSAAASVRRFKILARNAV